MTISTDRPIVVGTRGSPLALWQARHVIARLQACYPGRTFALQTIQTGGDVNRRVALAEIGMRGVFVKEIQAALLAGEIDLGVHSLKDLPSQTSSGLLLAAVCPRDDPADALVTAGGQPLAALPAGARLGTSSPRRAAQLRAFRPDLAVVDVRGNVDTRVRKALSREYDGVVLAVAGLRRLGMEGSIAERLPFEVMIPAPGQGIVAVEARADDPTAIALAASVDDEPTHLAARAERAFVRALGGGCTTPLGAHATVEGSDLRLVGVVASLDGRRLLRETVSGDTKMAEEVGRELAGRLLAAGADAILAEIERQGGPAANAG